MGKSGAEDSGGGRRVVKRQVVSVCGPGVEVVSEEKFARRLQGMSGCVGCHKERSGANTRGLTRGGKAPPRSYRNNNNNNNNAGSGSHNKNIGKQGRRGKQGKRVPSKANTPIVIHIKDTLRSALPHKERSLDTDSDVSVRSIDEDLFGDVSSIPEFKPQYMNPVSDSPPLTPIPLAVSSRTRRQSEKSKKNLTALISVIEKAHHKESCHIESNLVDASSGDSKLCRLLNNEVCAQEKSFSQQRSIVDCENVDVICNDLYKHGKGGPVEDTDSVSDRSSVSSSSEAVSDPDALFVEEGAGFEFSPEELQRLADYTTGYPIYRYDCSPSECPQCLSMWYYHQACLYEGCYLDTASSAHGAWTRGDCQNEDHDTTLEASEDESEMAESESVSDGVTWRTPGPRSRTPSTSSTAELISDDVSWGVPRDRGRNDSTSSIERIDSLPSSSLAWASWTTSSKSRQLWDIDISHGARPWERGVHPANPYPNSVYLDLTGTDVSISVFYHHSLLQDEGVQATLDTMARESAGSAPTAPLYSLCYQGSPVCGLSLPVSFFTDRRELPQIAMVPPHELKRYEQGAPPPRTWVDEAGCSTDATGPTAEVTVMSYNVLCDKYCTRQQYAYCPSWARSWHFRKTTLMSNIHEVNPDICCLQEVETKEFQHCFQSGMRPWGFEGFFAPKSRARTMDSQADKDRVDGCAIMFKKDKFEMVDYQVIEFSRVAMLHGNKHRHMMNRVMPRDNVGLVAVLRTKPGIFIPPTKETAQKLAPNLLMVATAHIHWDPEDSDVKMVQMMMFMAELRCFGTKFIQNNMPANSTQLSSIPLIFCGDLNSLPDSGVVEFLTAGKVAKNHPEFKGNDYNEILGSFGRVDDENIYHDFQLQRACEGVMPFTNFTYDFKGVIDYILYSRELLKVKCRLALVDEDWFRQKKVLGCPNIHVPSDHFCIAAVFEMPFVYCQDSSLPAQQESKSTPQQQSRSTPWQRSKSPPQQRSELPPQQQSRARTRMFNRPPAPHHSRRTKKPNRGDR